MKVQNNTQKTSTVTECLRKMTVGDTVEYPAEKFSSITSIASSVGFMMSRRYKVRRDKERRMVVVSRES